MKETIRKTLLGRRESLGETRNKSILIKRALFSSNEYRHAKTILFYMPIRNEVDTADMIREALKKKNVALPVTDTGNHRLIISRISSIEKMKQGAYGIPEPRKISELEPGDIDLVIVPGVAFDRRGGRIGFGKGYYDRFLYRLDIPRIALAYSFQVLDEVPVQDHDVKVDRIITENGVIDCS